MPVRTCKKSEARGCRLYRVEGGETEERLGGHRLSLRLDKEETDAEVGGYRRAR
jgi:hypothetical protein